MQFFNASKPTTHLSSRVLPSTRTTPPSRPRRTQSRQKITPASSTSQTTQAPTKEQLSATVSALFDSEKVKSEEHFFQIIQGFIDKKMCPPDLLPVWQDFYQSHKNAVVNSGVEGSDEALVLKIQCTIADRVFQEFVVPYTFPSEHKRILEPYNYYNFGQNYVKPLIDFENSVLGQPDRWDQISKWLKEGHNVVLLANHQTEADPAVFAHMLEKSNPELATDVIYVAGDRVITDALCKPFSMGRNLYCVYSKRHMDDDPDKKAEKAATNRRTLAIMSRGLNAGGKLLWIAPGGGRDRPNSDDRYVPAKWDPTSVELMRKLVSSAKQPGHLMPLAMYSWPIMPPPKKVETQLGEQRVIGFSGVGLLVGEEVEQEQAKSESSQDKEEQILAMSQKVYQKVCTLYDELEKVVLNKDARDKADWVGQPWK